MNTWLHKHRNLLLFALLLTTLTVSYFANQQAQTQAASTVTLPVVAAPAAPSTPLEVFRDSRDSSALQDMAALETLVAQENLDAQTRADAAAQLQRIVDHRQKETALEGALPLSGVYPCAAVVDEGSVTIITEKTTLSDGEPALIMPMAQTHADVPPSGVKVVSAADED